MAHRRAEEYGDKTAATFSYHGDGEGEVCLTYRQLDLRARAVAADLQARGARGERVLVLCRPGLDHIVGLFGCMYAGAVAVPVHERLAPRLSAVVPDARARFALGVTTTVDGVREALDSLGQGRDITWSLMDRPTSDPADWVEPAISEDDIALIQYTSGSTGSPKGVVITHGNLMHNVAAIRSSWGGDDTDVGCFWLPAHHDMGLIGAIFSMLYLGSTTHLMSPTAFIRQPLRWMEALARHRATFTAAPNFAYDLCVQHSTAEQRAALDLSSIRCLMNGAEPVQAATVRSFADAFAPAGLRADVFSPVYGLAEATLMVSGEGASPNPRVITVGRDALTRDRLQIVDRTEAGADTVELVGCGSPRGCAVEIVDPQTLQRCASDTVGEIWVSGPSIGTSYWARPVASNQILHATIPGAAGGPYLRTGDMGFLLDGELFITGRCRDLVTIRGAHHYPHDIEATAHRTHRALVSGRGAAFAFTPGFGAAERLVLVQEVDRGVDSGLLPGVLDAIRAEISTRHGLDVHTVVLVDPMTLPTTSSGKIQRGRCRRTFLDGGFTPRARWQESTAVDDLLKAVHLEKAMIAADLVRTSLAGTSPGG